MSFEQTFRVSYRVIAITLIVALLFSSLSAQTPAPQSQKTSQQGAFRIKVETELVLVNVVARDKQGRPVQDLKADDFTLLEDGKTQHITTFDSENLDTTPINAAAGPSQQTVADQSSASSKPLLTSKDVEQELNNKRVIVLFFDLTSLQPDELQRSVDAAKKYVQNKMTAADMIAIVSLASSLRLDADFTNDRARLLRILNRFTHSEGQGMDNGATGDTDMVEETGDAYTADESEYNQFNTDRKLQALQSVCQVLARFNQKKNIIYFSGGMTQTGIENEAALRAAVNTAVSLIRILPARRRWSRSPAIPGARPSWIPTIWARYLIACRRILLSITCSATRATILCATAVIVTFRSKSIVRASIWNSAKAITLPRTTSISMLKTKSANSQTSLAPRCPALTLLCIWPLPTSAWMKAASIFPFRSWCRVRRFRSPRAETKTKPHSM